MRVLSLPMTSADNASAEDQSKLSFEYENFMNKNYFVMVAESPWAGPTVKVVDVPDVRATRGKLIGNINKPFIVNLVTDPRALPTESFPPRDIHESAKFTLYSRKFFDLLNSSGVTNIEYFPADVTDLRTNQKLEYYVGNILGRINALDHVASEFILGSVGEIMSIERMVFDESKIQGHKIFMLGELPLVIIVHRSIKEAAEAEGLTGIRFFSDDEYEPGII